MLTSITGTCQKYFICLYIYCCKTYTWTGFKDFQVLPWFSSSFFVKPCPHWQVAVRRCWLVRLFVGLAQLLPSWLRTAYLNGAFSFPNILLVSTSNVPVSPHLICPLLPPYKWQPEACPVYLKLWCCIHNSTRDKGHLSLLVLGVLLKVPLKLRDITHNKVCPLTILASWFGMMSRIHPSVYPQQVSEELFWAHLGKISIFCNSTVFPSLFLYLLVVNPLVHL